MTTTALEPKLTIRQLAERWGMSIDAIYRLCKHKDPQRRLPHIVFGKEQIRFSPSELEEWLKRQPGHRLPEPVETPAPVMKVVNSRFRR
jgi:excisionase family DNA binding protein